MAMDTLKKTFGGGGRKMAEFGQEQKSLPIADMAVCHCGQQCGDECADL